MSFRSVGAKNSLTPSALAGVIAILVVAGAFAAPRYPGLICPACTRISGTTHWITALSGVPTLALGDYRHDQSGRDYTVNITVETPPQQGTVRTQVKSVPREQSDGSTRVVRETQVIYQSKKGYLGEDSFKYRRASADPADPRNGLEFTVIVTAR